MGPATKSIPNRAADKKRKHPENRGKDETKRPAAAVAAAAPRDCVILVQNPLALTLVWLAHVTLAAFF